MCGVWCVVCGVWSVGCRVCGVRCSIFIDGVTALDGDLAPCGQPGTCCCSVAALLHVIYCSLDILSLTTAMLDCFILTIALWTCCASRPTSSNLNFHLSRYGARVGRAENRVAAVR